MTRNGTVAAIALGVLLAAAAATAARAQDDLLKTIKDRGVMRVCDVDYRPWNIKNPATNEWEGINVDLVQIIASQLKVKLEHVDATWATVIPSIQTKKCDFSASGLYVSPARAELVTFTQPIAHDGISIFVPKDSTAKTPADVDQAGKTIVARSGSFEESFARQFFKHATVKALTADGTGVVLLEVAAGRADAAIGGYYGNMDFLKANANVKVRLLSDELLTRTPIAFAVPAKEYFFRDYLDEVLLTLEENNKIKEILAKWTY